jgi:hypothetical protein
MVGLIRSYLRMHSPRKSFKDVVVGGALICRQVGTQHVRVCIVKSINEDHLVVYSPSLGRDLHAIKKSTDWYLDN